MQAVNFPEDTPITSTMISKAVNQAQQKVEGRNFDIRKHLLDYDDVLNRQRTALYTRRTKILRAGEKNEVLPVVREVLGNIVERMQRKSELLSEATHEERQEHEKEIRNITEKIKGIPEEVEADRAHMIGHHLVRILDMLWVEHLSSLEALRESVGIRAYGQRDPIVEYRKDAHGFFARLNENFETMVFQTVFSLFDIDIKKMDQAEEKKPPIQEARHTKEGRKIGRNDPCWCGSGKKYKKCHGR
jgi:preprotein translocase subunit SecA